MNHSPDVSTTRPALSARAAGLQLLVGRMGGEVDGRTLAILSAADEPEPAMLVRCAQEAGVPVRAMTLRWGDLVAMARAGTPALLLTRDGGAAMLESISSGRSQVSLRDPLNPQTAAVEVDRWRLEEIWDRSAIVARQGADERADDMPFGAGWVWANLMRDSGMVRDITLASVVMACTTLAPPLIFMSIADRVLLFQSYSTLVMLAALLGVLTVFDVLMGWAKRHLSGVLARRMDGRISLMVMERLLHLPMSFFERTQAGDIQSRIFQVNRVRDFVAGPMFRTVLDVITVVLVVPVMFLISPPLTWMVLGLTAVLLLIIVLMRPQIRRAARAAVESERAKLIVLAETVQGMRTVKALAIEAQQSEAWNRRTAEATRANFEVVNATNRMELWTSPIEALFQRSVMVIGALLVLGTAASQTIGSLFAFTMLASRVSSPIMNLAGLLHSLEFLRMSVNETAEVVNQAPERPPSRGIRPQLRGEISFRDVTFTYPGATTPALKELSFEVPAGTMLGLVGRSGSGKSTVTRLLQALSSGYSGLVKIDGIELREIDLQHLRRNMGVVLQENFMFRGTIRDNILAGRQGLSFENVISACRLAGAEEFIERLPRSYDTMIEEGSPNLSGGQKQRLAIARALITDPPILILDEATSALDPESEAVVNENLRRIARGRTIIMVSHRLSSLVEADRILVLDKGEVASAGRHAELLTNSPIYRSLWEQQMRAAVRGAP